MHLILPALISILFLAACSTLPAATPAPTLIPLTPSAAPTSTPASTMTPVPPTAVPLDAYGISRDLEHPADLPREPFGNFAWRANQRFAAWVAAADAAGLFPDVPASAVPIGPGQIRAMTDAELELGKPDGMVPGLFKLLDPGYKDPALRPWVVAAAWQTSYAGEDATDHIGRLLRGLHQQVLNAASRQAEILGAHGPRRHRAAA